MCVFCCTVNRLRKEVRGKPDKCEVQIGLCRAIENLFGEDGFSRI